jgi:pteridine reductase
MRAVVTGGSGLIGRALATALAREGYDVLVHHHRSAQAAAETVEAIVAAGGVAHAVQADLRTSEGVQRLLGGLDELHLLVNALGAYARAPLAETTDEMLDEMLALNFVAPLRVTRAALPSLRAARGQVVQLLDIAASQPWRDHAAYAASKAAAAHMIRCLALELAPRVRVNAVSPGLVAGATGVDPDTFTDLEKRIPGGGAVTPDEVARAVVLLADLPRSVTGQIIAVDGGRSLGRRRLD